MQVLQLISNTIYSLVSPGLGLGYVTMKGEVFHVKPNHHSLCLAVTPTPEETYAALAPDLRRKVDANRAARLAAQQASTRQDEVLYATFMRRLLTALNPAH
jgi:hypothetical protein